MSVLKAFGWPQKKGRNEVSYFLRGENLSSALFGGNCRGRGGGRVSRSRKVLAKSRGRVMGRLSLQAAFQSSQALTLIGVFLLSVSSCRGFTTSLAGSLALIPASSFLPHGARMRTRSHGAPMVSMQMQSDMSDEVADKPNANGGAHSPDSAKEEGGWKFPWTTPRYDIRQACHLAVSQRAVEARRALPSPHPPSPAESRSRPFFVLMIRVSTAMHIARTPAHRPAVLRLTQDAANQSAEAMHKTHRRMRARHADAISPAYVCT